MTVTTASGYDRIEIENARTSTHGVTDSSLTGESFDLGKFGYTTTTTTTPAVTLKYDLSLTDSDGDTTALPNAINVNLSPAAAPIVLDLNNDGFTFIAHDDPSNHVFFDFNNSGQMRSTSWISGADAFLVFDANRDAQVNGANEIVFADPNDKDANTDLKGLALKYDTNHDSFLDSLDLNFSQFGLWQDVNLNGKSEAGEFFTLSDKGIVSLNLTGDGEAYSSAQGEVFVYGHSSFTYADGSVGTLADVALSTYETPSKDTEPNPLTDKSNEGETDNSNAAITGSIKNAQDGGSSSLSLELFGDNNDQLNIPENTLDFGRYSGGGGVDTITLGDVGITLNMDQIKEHFAGGFEQVDMTGKGENSLSLDFDAVLSLSKGSELKLELLMDNPDNKEAAFKEGSDNTTSVNVLKIMAEPDDKLSMSNAKDVTDHVQQGQIAAGDKVYQVSNADHSQSAYIHIAGAPVVQVETPMPPPSPIHG